MSSTSASLGDLQSWLKLVLERENLTEYTLEITGNTEKGDGYIGDVLFVTASGLKNSHPKTYNLVIKHGKKSDVLRETTPVRSAFESEIAIYEHVFPAFARFQHERNVRDAFRAFPKCYGTLMEKSMEVIVLANLKKIDYDLHDRNNTMDLEHIELVLKAYGKFHGISLAMKDQDYERYANVVRALKHDVFKEFVEVNGMCENMRDILKVSSDFLRKTNNGHVSDEIEKIIEYVPQILTSLSSDCNNLYTVLTHGDCWNNNFMFKYKDDQKKVPEKVCILDWQVSHLGSPVLDLSYFLFACCSPKLLNNLDDLLRIYHNALSDCILELGSDPDRLFPYPKLKEHWKKYAIFGVIITPMILKISLASKEEAPDFAGDLENGKSFADVLMFEMKDQKNYNRRLLELMTHPTFINAISCHLAWNMKPVIEK